MIFYDEGKVISSKVKKENFARVWFCDKFVREAEEKARSFVTTSTEEKVT